MTTANLNQEPQTDPADQHLIAGRYRLSAPVGRGRLGEIYEADDEEHRDLAVQRRVAIQLLPERITQDRGLFNKLKLGYTVLRATPHPSIVRILDFDHDRNIGYLVTDLLEGASLRVILENSTTLPVDEVIPVIRAVGNALQFLHAKSIVHGRLTAESVFVTENLDVRLLDVVPLYSGHSILGGVASGDPFTRCDIASDIYGLACLTYEMLAGKHPFNFHSLSEARHAGLRPARIDSLPQKQWDALCHALVFDSEQRTPAVADFLREFGVEGTERLQPSQDATAQYESASNHPVHDVPPPTHSAGPSNSAPAPAAATAPARSVPVARREEALDPARARSRRARRILSAVLAMVLAGLGAWYFYGQPRDDVARLIGYVDSSLDNTAAGKGNADMPVEASDATPVSASSTEPVNIPSAMATQPETENDAPAESADRSLAGEDAASNEFAAQATEEAKTEAVDESLAISGTVASPSSDGTAGDAPAIASDITQTSRSEARTTLIQSTVYVSERDGAVRIGNPLPASTTGRVFWWTADNTAIAENDYIPAEEPRQGFASGEESEMLHIPLVNDSLPEPRETFYVYLGRHNPQLGRLETIARISVEINDDDL